MLDEIMFPFSVTDRIDNKLKFLLQGKMFLSPNLRRQYCNALIQPHFDYTCSAEWPEIKKQNLDFPDFIELGKMSHISYKEFETLSYRYWRCDQWSMYVNDQCANYLGEVFEIPSENNIQPRTSFQILKFPFPKTSIGQTALV